MKKAYAQALLDKIQVLADCEAELAGEGNSGEFHNEQDEREMMHALALATDEFMDTFYQVTGWRVKFEKVKGARWSWRMVLDTRNSYPK